MKSRKFSTQMISEFYARIEFLVETTYTRFF
jgi:hypothetical protein